MVKVIAFEAGALPVGVTEFADQTLPVEAVGLLGSTAYRVFIEVGVVETGADAEAPGLENVTLSAARVGGLLKVNNPDPDRAYYVGSRRPGTNNPWMVQTMHDWSADGFTLDKRVMGLEFIVRSPNVDPETKLVTGYADSQVFGPILHQTDLPASNGTTVRWCGTAAELQAAIDSTDCTLAVLNPGTTWNLAAINFLNKNRLANRLTITTPQNNPARFTDSAANMDGTKGITFEGIVFRHSAAWAVETFNQVINSNSGSEGLHFSACRFAGDEVPESVRQDVRGYTEANPTGSAYNPDGFRFLVKPFKVLRGEDFRVTDCSMENVWTCGDFTPNVHIDRLSVRGIYFDGVRLSMQSSGEIVPGGTINDMFMTDCLTLADEMQNDSGGQAPHFDVVQIFGSGQYIEDLSVSNVVFCAGKTRASKPVAELGGYGQGEYPLMRTSTAHRGTVYRNGLATARGPSGFEFNAGKDIWADRICSLDFGGSGGGTSITTSTGTSSIFPKEETRITRSYAGTEIRDGSVGRYPDQYLTKEGNVVGLSNTATLEATLTKKAMPSDPIELAQYAKPQVDDGTGPLTAKGYLRPVNPIPPRTTATVAGLSPGGFRVTQATQTGATAYGFRYRLKGTNPWTMVWQASNVLNITNFAPEVEVEVDWAYRKGADYSRWNKEADRKAVTTASSPPATAPTLTLVPEIGGAIVSTTPTSSTSTGARNFSHYAAGAAPTAADHLALFIYDQTGGGGRTPGAPPVIWINQAQGNFDPEVPLTEVGVTTTIPAGSRKWQGTFHGKPPADARGTRIKMSDGSHTSAAASALFRANKAATQIQRAAATQLSATGTCTVTMTVPPGTAFAILAESNTGAPVLAAPVETLGGNDSTGNATYKWVAGRLYSSEGGSITITATNCRMLEVAAYTG